MASRAHEQGAVSAATASGTAKDTMSQFAARILDQLSLSAWLPSAALILIVAFLFQLGAVLDRPGATTNVAAVLGSTFAAMASVNLGGAALFVVGVVVITMITQAFEFEAIRVLEGYWGTTHPVEWVAKLRSEHFRRQRTKLVELREHYRTQAWNGAREAMESEQRRLENIAQPRQLTPDMIERMGAQAMQRGSTIKLTARQEKLLESIEWTDSAPPEPLRRIVNIDERLRFIPTSQRVLPTQLGNVLRSCEDQVGRSPIESFIQEVFDQLPLSLRVEHDEERGRLDLYCSMVFVLLLVTVLTVCRLAFAHILWCLPAVTVLACGTWLMYRAAIASAQAYGALLVTIGDWVDDHRDDAQSEAG
jgi:hypothetical protein